MSAFFNPGARKIRMNLKTRFLIVPCYQPSYESISIFLPGEPQEDTFYASFIGSELLFRGRS
jgi:hypothetical protein